MSVCGRMPTFSYTQGDLSDNRIAFVEENGWGALEEEPWIKDCAELWQPAGSQARKQDVESICALCHARPDDHKECKICMALLCSGKHL